MVCHRRAGKTVSAVHELAIRAIYSKKKNARYAYIAPFRSQAKNIAWVYLKEAVLGIATRIRESDLRVELPNGAWITLYGADNPDNIRGLYHDGVVLDEYGDCRPSLWGQVILPTLADRKGWALFIGTPKGKNHFYEIYQRSQKEEGWFSLTLKAGDSGILDKGELLEMKAQMDESEYDQEMECNFNAAIKGTYYADLIQTLELQGTIGSRIVKYDPTLPVRVAADLGRSDSTAMWFWQEAPDGINIIDYYEEQEKHIDHYIEMLNNKGYRYEEIWLPHDAKAKTLATKRSTVEQMLLAKFPCRIVPKLGVQHGIDAVRYVLKRVRIDQEKCFNGVEALRAYKRRYNELTKQYDNNPLHDWASDGSDGFRYLSLVVKDSMKFDKLQNFNDNSTISTYSQTLNDLFNDRDTSRTSMRGRV